MPGGESGVVRTQGELRHMFSYRATPRICLVTLLAAGLMGAQGCSEGLSETTHARPAVVDPPACRTVVANGMLAIAPNEEELRYFPVSRYHEFPVEVRPFIQRADIENDHCRGPGDNPETLRACNRRHCAMLELERRGWCRGGGATSAEDRWLPCSQIPGDPPMERELPFPEAEIGQMLPPNASALAPAR